MPTKPRTLDEWRDTIRREAPWVDIKPYSHNIIAIALSAIAVRWGTDEAEKAIDDFKLARKGWRKRGVL